MLRRRKKLFGGARFNPLVYSPALWLDASDPSTLVMDGARTFNGSNQCLSVASNSTIAGGNVPIWFAGWVYFTTVAAETDTIAVKINLATDTSADYAISKNPSNNLFFGISYYSGSYSGSVASASTVTSGQWYFIFAYHDEVAQKVYLSVNGGAFAESANTKTPQADTGKNLGLGDYSTVSQRPLNGKMDSWCLGKPSTGWLASNATALRDYLYNGGSGRRSSDFLASAYYTGGNPSGAVSWWDMDARSGTETDRIGTNHLTDNGGVGYAAGVASGLVQYTGDPVKQWSDKSGNARHFTAPSDAARPTYTTNAQNGLSVITWDGVNDGMSVASSALANAANATVFLVVKNTAGSSPKIALQTNGPFIQFDRDSGVYYPTVGGSGAAYANYASASSSPRIISSVYDGTQTGNSNRLKSYENGTQQTLTYTGTITATLGGITNWYIGYSGATYFHDGQIMEILVIPSTLNDGDLAKFHRYLGNKWGITVA